MLKKMSEAEAWSYIADFEIEHDPYLDGFCLTIRANQDRNLHWHGLCSLIMWMLNFERISAKVAHRMDQRIEAEFEQDEIGIPMKRPGCEYGYLFKQSRHGHKQRLELCRKFSRIARREELSRARPKTRPIVKKKASKKCANARLVSGAGW